MTCEVYSSCTRPRVTWASNNRRCEEQCPFAISLCFFLLLLLSFRVGDGYTLVSWRELDARICMQWLYVSLSPSSSLVLVLSASGGGCARKQKSTLYFMCTGCRGYAEEAFVTEALVFFLLMGARACRWYTYLLLLDASLPSTYIQFFPDIPSHL